MANGLSAGRLDEIGTNRRLSWKGLWPGPDGRWGRLPAQVDPEALFPVEDFEYDYSLYQPWDLPAPVPLLFDDAYDRNYDLYLPMLTEVEDDAQRLVDRFTNREERETRAGTVESHEPDLEKLPALMAYRDALREGVANALARLRDIRFRERSIVAVWLEGVYERSDEVTFREASDRARRWWEGMTTSGRSGDWDVADFADEYDEAYYWAHEVFEAMCRDYGSGSGADWVQVRGVFELEKDWGRIVREGVRLDRVLRVLDEVVDRARNFGPAPGREEVAATVGSDGPDRFLEVMERIASLVLVHDRTPGERLEGAVFEVVRSDDGCPDYVVDQDRLPDEALKLYQEVYDLGYPEGRSQSKRSAETLLRERLKSGNHSGVLKGMTSVTDMDELVRAAKRFADRERQLGRALPVWAGDEEGCRGG